jgi:PAS domain S-box-containing protein
MYGNNNGNYIIIQRVVLMDNEGSLDNIAERGLDSLEPGTHAISLYDDEQSEVSKLVKIISERLDLEERYIFFANIYTKMRIIEAFKRNGLDVDAMKSSGKIAFYPGAYNKYSDENAVLIKRILYGIIDSGMDAGYKKTFLFNFPDSLIIQNIGRENIIKIESVVIPILKEKGAIAICLYDRTKFSEYLLMDMVKIHDTVMEGRNFYKNVDFVEPGLIIARMEDRKLTFDHYFDSIISRAKLQSALSECSKECEIKYKDKDKKLKQAEEILSSVLNSTSDAVVTRDKGLRITSWNPSAERLTGYKFDEVSGKTIDELKDIYIEFDKMKEHLIRVKNGENIVDMDMIIKHKSGRILSVSTSISPIRGSDGSIIGIITVNRDITERKSTEKDLKKLNRDLILLGDISMMLGRSLNFEKIMSDTLDKLVTLMGADNGMVHIFDESKGIFTMMAHRGLTDHDAEGMKIFDVGTGNVATMIFRLEPVFIEDHKIPENPDITRNIGIRSRLCMPLVSKDRIVGMIGLSSKSPDAWNREDLSLLKVLGGQIGVAVDNALLYRQILESRDFMNNIIENSADAITTFDPEGKVLIWNRASEKLFGISREDAIGRVFPASLDISDPFRLLNDVKGGKVFRDVDLKLKRKDGTLIDISSTMSPIYDASRDFMGMLAITRDITDRKKLENQLIDAKNEAELYVDIMSHDINNLNFVGMGHIELLKLKSNLCGECQEMADKAYIAFNNSARIISNIKKFKELKTIAEPRQRIDLSAVLDEVVSLYSVNVRERVAIEYAPAKGVFVYADHFLKDIFLNIIGNAIKYSKEKPGIRIDVIEEPFKEGEKEYCRIIVEDNGMGIKDEDKQRIFGKNFRGYTHISGAGLGLYIVRSLVDRYGGKVWVEDKVKGEHEKGSRFILLLESAGNAGI